MLLWNIPALSAPCRQFFMWPREALTVEHAPSIRFGQVAWSTTPRERPLAIADLNAAAHTNKRRGPLPPTIVEEDVFGHRGVKRTEIAQFTGRVLFSQEMVTVTVRAILSRLLAKPLPPCNRDLGGLVGHERLYYFQMRHASLLVEGGRYCFELGIAGASVTPAVPLPHRFQFWFYRVEVQRATPIYDLLLGITDGQPLTKHLVFNSMRNGICGRSCSLAGTPCLNRRIDILSLTFMPNRFSGYGRVVLWMIRIEENVPHN